MTLRRDWAEHRWCLRTITSETARPAGVPVCAEQTFIVSLEFADGREILSEQIGAPMELPVTPDAWRRRFSEFLQREDRAWSYLEAAIGRLKIDGEALGRCTLRFEHDALPLRWVLRRDHGKIILRLVDDTGQDGTNPDVHFYSMERPLKTVPLAPEDAFSGITVAPPGGLFLATQGTQLDSVAVSTGLTGEGLQGLGVRPSFLEALDGSATITACFEALELWQKARLAGFLSGVRREQVASGLVSAIFKVLYGSEWKRAEEIQTLPGAHD